MTAAGYRLAVLGAPIAHSKSPALHAAAYRVLGLDWSYSAVETTEATLAAVVSGERWHGLSLTMPLKHAVRPLLAEEDPVARTTGAVNTVLVDRSGAGPRSAASTPMSRASCGRCVTLESAPSPASRCWAEARPPRPHSPRPPSWARAASH
ncbi:shikimate dehydrogenase family protein [Rathayibacter tanaceti]|uniref:shikimate dehydrogenase family protein n=1 Tax=Rathayibacter tanaceti TaxID=1671680 RepID=UPI000AFA4135|nr:hypothetical protein [Rathayibacter tanaceti]